MPWRDPTRVDIGCWSPNDVYIIWLSNHLSFSVHDDGYCRNLPDDGHCRNVPDDGYCRNVPDDSYCRNVPDDGYCRNVPDDDYCRNTSCSLILISTFLYSRYAKFEESQSVTQRTIIQLLKVKWKKTNHEL